MSAWAQWGGGGAQKMLCFSIFSPKLIISSHISQNDCSVENITLPIAQHAWFCGGSVMLWGGLSMEGHMNLYRTGNSTVTALRYQIEILGPIIRSYPGAGGPGFVPSAWQCLASCSVQVLPVGWKDPHHWLPLACPKSSRTPLGHCFVLFVQENQ